MGDPKERGEVPRQPSKSGFQPATWFWESRKKGPTTAGHVLFVALRALDLPLQYYILSSGLGTNLISRLGGTPAPAPLASHGGLLGLSQYHTLVMGLAAGSAAKQIYWKLAINDTVMPAGFSVGIAVYNTLLNTLNTGFALWAATCQDPSTILGSDSFASLLSRPTIAAGTLLYTVGLFTEWYCEIQRASFKRDPANKGKPYSGGLFSLARNINYGGYTLWRTGYSLICAGWGWGVVQAAWLAGDFAARAIPSLDAYCEQRYGEQWEEVRRKVPYRLLPWVY